jgi:hypothetical protein
MQNIYHSQQDIWRLTSINRHVADEAETSEHCM